MKPQLQLFAFFHLNLAYSSIEEDQHAEVLRRCYWPLLRLAAEQGVPLGIEASGLTLELAAAADPGWVAQLRQLCSSGACEFIGSGYAQLIGPLVPPQVNAANLRLGHATYERLLGRRPQLALVNEQAYSAGLVSHYLEAGYRAIVMDWDNPSHAHPEWNPHWRYLPQRALGTTHGEQIPLLWSQSIAFQKFQRYAHGEMEFDEYLAYLTSHLSESPRALPLYANDAEIFDFRPGRYEAEAPLREPGEWGRIRRLFHVICDDDRFRLVSPSDVLGLLGTPGSGNGLQLESSDQPIPVKKQGKYNITRWAVTGRDDLGINTACWHLLERLKEDPSATDENWRELCALWSSDFRTHITERRWEAVRARLVRAQETFRAGDPAKPPSAPKLGSDRPCKGNEGPGTSEIARDGRWLTVTTEAVRLRLNCFRGLAIDELRFPGVSELALCGTLPHGYYDDIAWGADYYSAHLVLETPGRAKVTDLNTVEPRIVEGNRQHPWIGIEGEIATPLGAVHKQLRVYRRLPRVELAYRLAWDAVPPGSLRLGYVTLNPRAFAGETLFYRTHNGGREPETFRLGDRPVDHGRAVSFLVSARQALGLTGGIVELGDASRVLRVEVDKAVSALVGMITYQKIGDSYFCRLALSAQEMDETSRAGGTRETRAPLVFRLALTTGGGAQTSAVSARVATREDEGRRVRGD